VRIEDDYIGTDKGVEWISRAPREIAEVEAMMKEALAEGTKRDATRWTGTDAPADRRCPDLPPQAYAVESGRAAGVEPGGLAVSRRRGQFQVRQSVVVGHQF
jgi:hypothetical protein